MVYFVINLIEMFLFPSWIECKTVFFFIIFEIQYLVNKFVRENNCVFSEAVIILNYSEYAFPLWFAIFFFKRCLKSVDILIKLIG